jgi:membrane protease YdiL (CAAX protease family)
MTPRMVLTLALLTQGVLIALAWAAGEVFDLWPRWGHVPRDIVVGLAAAIALGGINHFMLVRAPSNWIVNGVRAVYDETLVPLFARISPAGVVVLGAAAGVGEEWLFRGVLQPVVGLLWASVAFGVAHVGGLRMLPFGVWASMMGLVMGGLAIATGGLIAPIVAHGVYDMLALEYIRRGANH